MSSLRKGGGHTLLGNALFERGNHRKPAFTKGGKKKKEKKTPKFTDAIL